ncbi:hypothetical protein ABGA96_07030 [Staphylococcus arlettae]|uniref:hypothetical protein n=1 Tax=Staphylococcus arlettae TaxID=29378 RepID=UPI0034645563
MMQRNNNFNEYPKILKIEDDGTIIALDKHGKVNTDLNTHSVTDEQQYDIFGEVLYSPYSRIQKYQQSYAHDSHDPNHLKSEAHYNLRDRERELQLLEENKKTKRKNTWLGLSAIILLLIVGVFAVTAFFNSRDDGQQNQTEQAQTDNQNQNDAGQGENVNFEHQNSKIESQIQTIKDDISNGNDETESKLQSLQDKVDSVKQEADSSTTENLADKYQSTVNNLEQAKDQQENGNSDQMQEELDKVNNKLDDIKDKFSSFFDNNKQEDFENKES